MKDTGSIMGILPSDYGMTFRPFGTIPKAVNTSSCIILGTMFTIHCMTY